jgi:hypothetical protein
VCSAAAIVLPVGALTDRDPGARRSVKVDVVDADPRPADDDEAGACRDELGVHLDLAAHDQRVVVGQDRPELLASTADALVDLVVRGEEIDAFAATLSATRTLTRVVLGRPTC